MQTARTPWDFLDAYPPPYCRLLAKEPGGGTADMAITDAELAIRADLPLSRVREITRLDSWRDVPLGEMRAFFQACNFDPTNAVHRDRVNRYERKCTKRNTMPFRYLRVSPKWEEEFRPLFAMVGRMMASRGGFSPTTPTSGSPARS